MRRIFSLFLIMMLCLTNAAQASSATSQLQEMYAQAELSMALGDYSGAADQFDKLGAYADASQMAMYCKALAAAESLGLYNVAEETFRQLGDFKDSSQLAIYYNARGMQAYGDSVDIKTASDDDLKAAQLAYETGAEKYAQLALFKDCLTRMTNCQRSAEEIKTELSARKTARTEETYQQAYDLESAHEYQKAIKLYQTILNYKDSKNRITACIYQQALLLENEGKYQEAIDIYQTILDYKDSKNRITACIYQQALALEISGDYRKAIELYQSIEKSNQYQDIPGHILTCALGWSNIVLQSDSKEKWEELRSLLLPFSDDERVKPLLERIYRCTVFHGGFYQNVALYYDEEAQKFGFMDEAGRLLTDPIYDRVSCGKESAIPLFSDGLCPVMQGDKLGYVDLTGQIAIPIQYKSVWDFHDGLAMVESQNGKKSIINKTGKVIYTLTENDSCYFQGTLGKDRLYFSMSKNADYGLMDLQGNALMEYYTLYTDKTGTAHQSQHTYKSIAPFRGNTALILCGEHLHGLLAVNGKQVFDPWDRQYWGLQYITDTKLLFMTDKNKYGIIDDTGRVLIQAPMKKQGFTAFESLQNGYLATKKSPSEAGNERYILDANGTLLTLNGSVMPFYGVSTVSVSHCFAAAQKDGGSKLYRIEGIEIIPVSDTIYKGIIVGENSTYYMVQTYGGLNLTLNDKGEVTNR